MSLFLLDDLSDKYYDPFRHFVLTGVDEEDMRFYQHVRF